jgi:hypothetical protein
VCGEAELGAEKVVWVEMVRVGVLAAFGPVDFLLFLFLDFGELEGEL